MPTAILLLAALAASDAVAPAKAANPQVVIETTLGSFTLELFAAEAPKTVENFLAYVKDGHYEGTLFHRVIPGFMAQGGGYTADFRQKPTRPGVQNEANNRIANARGTVAMARTSDPNSATSQFFVNVADNKPLDHTDQSVRGWGYCVFGKVVSGMEVVDAIVKTPTGAKGPFRTDAPVTDVVIKSVRVVG